MRFLSLVAVAAAILTVPASAAQKVAIFPFDIHDISQDAEVVPQYQDDDLRRLKVVADELAALMAKSDKYQVIDTSAFGKQIEAAAPFNRCDGCEVAIAKEAGAELAVTGNAEKLSDALISLQVFVRDVASGKPVKSMSAEIRGNTDELWLHGIRWLWRNRFNADEASK